MDVLYGWGVLLSTNININEKNIIYSANTPLVKVLQIIMSDSVAGSLMRFMIRNLEKMTQKFIRGGFPTYTHIFNPAWRFSLTGGKSLSEGMDFESADTFRSSRYFAANFFFNPIETINLGIELTTGSRTNLDHQKANATRISLLGSFSF